MKYSIRTVLVVPFLVQIFATVGLVGWFSFRNGQKAVENVVSDLRNETTARVEERVSDYLKNPQLVNRINREAFESDQLNIDNLDNLARYFWTQLQAFQAIDSGQNLVGSSGGVNNTINNIYVGIKSSGVLLGAERGDTENELLIFYTRENEDASQTELCKSISNDGRKGLYIKGDCKEFTLTERDWYKEAVNSGQEFNWSNIYEDLTTGRKVITATSLVNLDGGQLVVFASDLLLNEIDQFLESLEVSQTGATMIVERETLETVASSANNSDSPSEQINAQELIEAIDNQIDLENISASQNAEIVLGGSGFLGFGSEKYFVQASPIKNQQNLDWIILTSIPESDFMDEINANTRTTVILCVLALTISVAIGLLIFRQIFKPIQALESLANSLSDRDNVKNFESHLNVKNPLELSILAITFNRMGAALKEHIEDLEKTRKRSEDLKNSYERYVPKKFSEILNQPITEIEPGDSVRKRMTILFSDIRSFTDLSENMSTEDNFRFINAFLQRMEPQISSNHGFVDKYIGDAIMALFDRNGGELDSIHAAIGMLKKLNEYNEERENYQPKRDPIKIGIGIHTGFLMIGTVGGENRMDSTVISKEVNLASRLEGLTKRFGVSLLVSRNTLNEVKESDLINLCYRFTGRVKVKGANRTMDIYEICDAYPPKVSAKKMEYKEKFENAINLYRDRQFEEALIDFENILTACPEDNVASYYIQRCKYYLGNRVPENWQGVEEFDEK